MYIYNFLREVSNHGNAPNWDNFMNNMNYRRFLRNHENNHELMFLNYHLGRDF